MDNGLVQGFDPANVDFFDVLILIVVDNGLVHKAVDYYNARLPVLILIVVDNGLVHFVETVSLEEMKS